MFQRYNRSVTPRRLSSLVFALSVMLVLFIPACGGSTPRSTPAGEQAPPFTLPNALGGTLSLAAYAGKQPVLLFFHMADG